MSVGSQFNSAGSSSNHSNNNTQKSPEEIAADLAKKGTQALDSAFSTFSAWGSFAMSKAQETTATIKQANLGEKMNSRNAEQTLNNVASSASGFFNSLSAPKSEFTGFGLGK